MKKYFLSLSVFLAFGIGADAQTYSALWQPVTGPVASKSEQALHPDKFKTFRTSEAGLSTFLNALPADPSTPGTIDLPAPDGTYQSFLIWQTPIMTEALATRYPDIHTFTAVLANDHTVTAKLDYTPFGFHAMVFDGRNAYLVDPYGSNADGNYLSYYKHDYPRPVSRTASCEIKDKIQTELGQEPILLTDNGLPGLANKENGTVKRKYRLALACTGEYAVAVAGATPTKALVLAQMVTTANRVNGVFERELSYTLELIANTDNAIYLSGGSDPFTNSNASTMLGENQSNMDLVIGDANYDVGHVFSTGFNGIAKKSSVCQPGLKAQGVTGRNNPTGDAFDIDFVAHEMGHQFGADHTFNYTGGGSCAGTGNGVAAFAYEPGGGSTIMAYAGICGGNNDYQAHSDDYFHSASLEQITNYISSTGCAVTSASSNTNAAVPSYTAYYTIPYLTPFELTGPTVTDATADAIKYAWEERDLGDFGKTLAATKLRGPIFRPYPPTASPTRIFPQIDSLLKNAFPNNGEKLADTGRTLAFRYVERDIFQGFGCFNIPVDSIRLTVIYTGIPFKVTSPSGSPTWQAGGNATVTWNVGFTNLAPISCANVDIYLSADGGYTFPYTLASGTPNDGSETITIPNVNTSKMRIKVKGAGNVFFSISNADGTVQGGVGMQPVGPLPEVTVAPVPARDVVIVTAKNNTERLSTRVINSLGQTVWNGQFTQSLSIPVNTWARGLYYLQLRDERGAVVINRTMVIE